jgi:hypothetical protein
MAERRIINKMKEKPPEVDVSAENITIKEPVVPTLEERILAVETYLASADPYIRAVVQIDEIKKQLALFNDEITRVAGIQSRANSYLDGKLGQIDQTLEAIVTIVKKHDDDYRELMSDIEPEDLYEEEPVTTPTPIPAE